MSLDVWRTSTWTCTTLILVTKLWSLAAPQHMHRGAWSAINARLSSLWPLQLDRRLSRQEVDGLRERETCPPSPSSIRVATSPRTPSWNIGEWFHFMPTICLPPLRHTVSMYQRNNAGLYNDFWSTRLGVYKRCLICLLPKKHAWPWLGSLSRLYWSGFHNWRGSPCYVDKPVRERRTRSDLETCVVSWRTRRGTSGPRGQGTSQEALLVNCVHESHYRTTIMLKWVGDVHVNLVQSCVFPADESC